MNVGRAGRLQLVLLVLVCSSTLLPPPHLAAGNDGMTVIGKVTTLPAADIARRPASFFDLEGKTVTFTPDGEGRYAVRVGPLTWVETDPETGRFHRFRGPVVEPPEDFEDRFRPGWFRRFAGEYTGIGLPFDFPFAGRTWRRVHANTNGNVSFAAPERAHWEHRRAWAAGTMRNVAAAVDSRSAAGLEAMIAVLWAVYGETALSVDSSPERVAITWNALRVAPNGYHSYEPIGPNVFQVRLYPSATVELAYREVSERDGIVGLLQGAGDRGRVLSAVDDEAGDVRRGPNDTVDIVSAELIDNGSTVIASVTMADDIPDRVSSGAVSYRFFLDFADLDSDSCVLELRVDASGRTPGGSCGARPRSSAGYTVQGSKLEIQISKILIPDDRTVSRYLDAVWWGTSQSQWDQIDGYQPVAIRGASDRDLSSMEGTVTGSVFEVFYYPSIARGAREVMRSIYRQAPAGEELALVFTDFRFDDLYNTGPASGPINAPVQGIGDSQADPTDGSRYGSDSLLSVPTPLFIGGPRSVETGVDDNLAFHDHAWVIWWIAHELVHRWAAHLRFRDPATGRIESLTGGGCRCHCSEWLHAPVRHPVGSGYSNQPYPEASTMGGRLWRDNGDGTFTRQRTGFPLAEGLSDLDLYVMGMIPPEEVRPTFLLRNVAETGTRRTIRAAKVPVRIADIVAAMGPRVPSASEQRRVFRLGVYLLHEDGRAPRADLLARTRSVTDATVKYFALATGGSVDANRPPVVTATLPDHRLMQGSTIGVNAAPAFADADGDALTYRASSSAPGVATALAAGARVTLRAVGVGAATIRVTATDPGGLSAAQSFGVTVISAATGAPFADDPIVPGSTPIRAIHFTELRTRIDALRQVYGLARFAWTDPTLTAGVTPVRRVHLLELRSALAEAYAAAGREAPGWTDAVPATGSPIRAVHVMELRSSVRALEQGQP